MINFFRKLLDTSKKYIYGVATTSTPSVSWPDRNYENYAKEAYLKNLISFRCIDMISKSVASVKWDLFKQMRDDKRELVEEHPINKILKRPNPKQSWLLMCYEAIAFLLLSGNQFLLKVAPTGGDVQEMYVLNPSMIKINKNDDGSVQSYEYGHGSNKKIYEVDRITGFSPVLHTRFFNPMDSDWGSAIVESAAREIDTNNAAVDWHKGLLDNQARPGLMLIFEKYLATEQRKLLQKDLRDNLEGGRNAGLSLILEGAKDAKPYGFNPTEMDFIEGNRDKARAIASAFGVPAQLLGIKGDQTFANFAEARLFFWEDTIFWYLNLMKEQLNYWLFPDEDIFLDYIVDDVPALALKQDARWKRANEASFISENEKREMVGYDAIDGGDVILVSANMIPLEMASRTDNGDDESNAIADDEEKLIQELIDKGYSRDEAVGLLSTYTGEE